MEFTVAFIELFFWSIYLVAPLLGFLTFLIIALGQIVKQLAIRAEVGRATGRNLEFTLSNGDEFDLGIEDASFVGVSLEYRP